MKKRKKKSGSKWVWIIIALMLGFGIWGFVKAKASPKGIEVTVGDSGRGDITSVVTATGKVFPQVEVKLSSEVSGEIIELPVRDGQKVEKGDLLVRVNTDTLEAQVAQQEAALNASRASSAQSKAQMEQAELNFNRTRNLADRGFATEDEFDQARTNLAVASAGFDASVHHIARQDMQLKEAKDALAKASTYAPVSGTVTALSSEIGDRVVGTGQFAGTEILRLANLYNMEVRVNVAEADIVNVKVGDIADIEIDSLPDEKFAGAVWEIANSANTQGQGSQEQLTTFQVRVRFDASDGRFRPGMTATADIRTKQEKDVVFVPLQSVTVRQKWEVESQLKKDSGAADTKKEDEPRRSPPADATAGRGPGGGGARGGPGARRQEMASARDSMQRVVFVVKGDQAVLTPVETGISDSRNIQIISGLKEGQRIVTGSYGVLTRELKHDSQIRVKEGNGKDGNRKGPPTK